MNDLRAAHAAGARKRLLDLRPELPEALARVVEAAISPGALHRFASTGQMIAALDEAMGTGSGRAIELSPAKPGRFRAWMLAPLAVATTALVLLLPQARAVFKPRSSAPALSRGMQQEFLKAHDLLEHDYRPPSLDMAISLLEKVVAQDSKFAPAVADLARADVLLYERV